MKKTKTLILALAASLSFVFATSFLSCSNEEEESTPPAKDGETEILDYAVGKKVTIGSDKYIVLKNDFISSDSNRAAEDSVQISDYYQNPNAQKVRRQRFAKDYGIEKYIEVFKITTRKDTSSKDISSLKDEYLILNQESQKLVKIKQTWQSSTLFTGTSVEKSTKFNELTENQIREYDPDYLDVDNLSTLYGKDLSKKVSIQYQYKRNSDKTVDYDTLIVTQDNKNFLKMTYDGKEKAPYRIYTTYYNGVASEPQYILNRPTGSNFGSFYTTGNSLTAEGDGKLNGSTSTSTWYARLSNISVTDSNINFYVSVSKNNKSQISEPVSVTFDGLSSDETAKKYVTVEEATDGSKLVTFTVPYEDTTVPLQKYRKITYKKSGDTYVPDVDKYLNTYIADFDSLYTQAMQEQAKQGQ